MTATVAPRCRCTHSGWRHVAAKGHCMARTCHCHAYREAAPEPTPAEQAEIRRFGISTEDEK